MFLIKRDTSGGDLGQRLYPTGLAISWHRKRHGVGEIEYDRVQVWSLAVTEKMSVV
jgi:hypothetical protein